MDNGHSEDLLLVMKDPPHRATGQKRITDRFVKYPYPSNVGSVYQKEIAARKKHDNQPPAYKNAFNLEKEPKAQVKHKFTGNSSHVVDYKVPKHGGKHEAPS
jgi:hypothetical protein